MSLLEVLYTQAPFERSELLDIISTAPRRYKVYEVPKRQGNGSRTIAQPSPEVKLLQRLVMHHVIERWPVHDAAIGYRRQRSILTHATRHASSRFLLKLDFKDFFPSISSMDVKQHALCQAHPSLDTEDVDILAKILSWRDKVTGRYCLSIGAPSSPSCSNAVLYAFDKALTEACGQRQVTYSRYADDLAFSTQKAHALDEIEQITRALVLELKYPRLALNESKTVNVSKRFRRSVVGLVLTPEGKVSIGRDRKHGIRASIHAFTQGKLTSDEVDSLRGMLAYVLSVEPTFVDSLVRTYGPETITLLQLPLERG